MLSAAQSTSQWPWAVGVTSPQLTDGKTCPKEAAKLGFEPGLCGARAWLPSLAGCRGALPGLGHAPRSRHRSARPLTPGFSCSRAHAGSSQPWAPALPSRTVSFRLLCAHPVSALGPQKAISLLLAHSPMAFTGMNRQALWWREDQGPQEPEVALMLAGKLGRLPDGCGRMPGAGWGRPVRRRANQGPGSRGGTAPRTPPQPALSPTSTPQPA